MTARFVIAKLCRAVLTLWLVATFVFVVLHSSGDPLRILLPEDTPKDVVETYRARWGLDGSVWAQYWRYLVSVLTGDFGRSFRDGRPALDIVIERVPLTLLLGSISFGLSVLIGIPAGIFAALKRNSFMDRIVMAVTVFGHSLPTFFFGILMILLFSLVLRWLPSSGSSTPAHIIMPALTIGLWNAATLARFTRSAMLDTLGQPYMRAALANGLPATRRIFGYALTNAAIPIVTIIGLIFGQIIGGAVIVETVFAWPGLGRLTVSAVSAREIPVVQAIVLLSAASMVGANLAVDLVQAWLDPRLRAARQ